MKIFIAAIIALLIMKQIKYKTKHKIYAALICVSLIMTLPIWSLTRSLSTANTESASIFSTINLNEKGTYEEYNKYLIPCDDNIKNILLCGSDRRPDSTEEFRTDITTLLSINKEKNTIHVFELLRETQVRIGINDDRVCQLNEVTALTNGSYQSLVNCIALNYGIHIDEIIVAEWTSVIEFIDVFFEGKVKLDLSEIELLGINQVLPSQNSDLGYERKKDLILDDDGTIFGKEQLAYIANAENFIVEPAEDGNGYDSEGNYISQEQANSEHLYNINELIKNTAVERTFSEKKKAYELNSNQLLAFLRVRHAYPSQNKIRSKNLNTLLVKLAPSLIAKINTDEFNDMIKEFSASCSEEESFKTSYSSLNDIINDFVFPLKALYNGKSIEGTGKIFSEIPYAYIDYNGELSGEYNSVKKQTQKLIFS